jgi:hypothetical protein
MKEDGCGKTENKGEMIDEEDGIFPFEGEDEGERVWIVLAFCNFNCFFPVAFSILFCSL